MGRPKIDRTGERFTTNEGYKIIIVEYNSAKDLWIEFQDEYKTRVHTKYGECKSGMIRNPYHKRLYNVGFIGVGKYDGCVEGKQTKIYNEWCAFMARGLDLKFKQKYPTYKDVTVDEYFHNFQNYGAWREQNYYEIEGEIMCLDKDILVKGNKVYSPDVCVFVPQRINNLFVKSDATRGEYPIGVTYDKRRDKYVAKCKVDGKTKYLGSYNTSHNAFLAYKEFKEAYIKQVADEYKDKIPQRLYDAMYAWTVEEDD